MGKSPLFGWIFRATAMRIEEFECSGTSYCSWDGGEQPNMGVMKRVKIESTMKGLFFLKENVAKLYQSLEA